jgi:thymidine phosphorylase
VGKDGVVWANLCDEHNAEVQKSLESGKAAMILSTWVAAQGGAGKAAERTKKTVSPTMLKLAQILYLCQKKRQEPAKILQQ